MNDRWHESTAGAEPETEYGWIYDYRMPDGSSSGVAAYEPMIGGEENAVRRAKPFSQKVLLASSYNLFADGNKLINMKAFGIQVMEGCSLLRK